MLLSLALALTLTAPEHVSVGVQLRNVEAIDLQENAYHANFVLWVTWSGERDATKTLRFTNLLEAWAMTLSPVFDEPVTLADGRHYQRFTGEGRFFHKFELGSFPLDRQDVVLELEDVQRDASEVVFELDPQSSVTEGLKIPGWMVGGAVREVAEVGGQVGVGAPGGGAHSRVRFGLELQRPRRVFFVTMFPPILLVMLCCWFIFFLRPIHVEARVGTVITALLTTVFLQLAFTDDLPYLGTTVLLDQVFNFSYVIITAVLLECVLVMRWHDLSVSLEASLTTMPESERPVVDAERRAARARAERLDARSKWLFPAAYAAGCAVIVLSHLA
ncbi:MAG: hypothetical protein U0228_33380 [Myxococcaceae bacterium]